jgi:hypothetical protein
VGQPILAAAGFQPAFFAGKMSGITLATSRLIGTRRSEQKCVSASADTLRAIRDVEMSTARLTEL